MWARRRIPAIGILLFLAGCASSDVSEPLATLTGADIVILGEVHDNPAHHRNQADIIRAMQPSAVVFEMLSPEQAAIVNATEGRSTALRDALAWDDSGWPDWTLYQPVFEAAGNIPVYGMALPAADVNRAVTDGAAAVFGPGSNRFGLDQSLPAAVQAERESHQQASHCNMLPASLLPGMVEAQRLRDAAFARTALEALEATGGPVLVITGSGHARTDWGMPVPLRQAAPGIRVASLGQLEAVPTGDVPYDAWLAAEPAPREDPCKAFAKHMDNKDV